MHFYTGCSDERKGEIINGFNFRCWEFGLHSSECCKNSHTQPCVTYSKFWKHSWNSLWVQLQLMREHCLNAIKSYFQIGSSDWSTQILKTFVVFAVDQAKCCWCQWCLVMWISTVLGVPPLVREYSKCSGNSLTFSGDWDFHHWLRLQWRLKF